MDLLECKALYIGYSVENPLIRNMDFSLAAGEVVALMGENGCGKSTLLKTFAGLVPALSGNLLVGSSRNFSAQVTVESLHARAPRELAKRIALVRMSGMEPGRLTVREFVGLGRMPYSGFLDGRTAEDERIVADAMSLLEVAGFASRPVAELSDGERSRVYLARAVAQQVQVLLLDEPNAFLDIPRSHRLFKILKDLSKNHGMGIVVSTHSVEYAEKYCNRIAVIDGGEWNVADALVARSCGLFRWAEKE